MLFVFYTGVGATKRKHTIDEFLQIMKNEYTDKSWKQELEIVPREYYDELCFKDWVLPDDFVFFRLEDWLEYSGAELHQE